MGEKAWVLSLGNPPFDPLLSVSRNLRGELLFWGSLIVFKSWLRTLQLTGKLEMLKGLADGFD
jgi:hypothetical protein